MIDLGGFCGHESLGMLVLGPDLWISPPIATTLDRSGCLPIRPVPVEFRDFETEYAVRTS